MADATSRVRFLNTDGSAEWATLAAAGIVPSTSTPVLVRSATIASADLLTSNSIPISVLNPQGANKIAQIVAFIYQFDYNTTPYATNVNAFLRYAGATFDASSNILLDKSDANYYGVVLQPLEYVQPNTAIELYTSTGNPTAGDSDLNVWLFYTILDVS